MTTRVQVIDEQQLIAAIDEEHRGCTPLSTELVRAYERNETDPDYSESEAVRDVIRAAVRFGNDYILRDCREMLARAGLTLSAFDCSDTNTAGGAE